MTNRFDAPRFDAPALPARQVKIFKGKQTDAIEREYRRWYEQNGHLATATHPIVVTAVGDELAICIFYEALPGSDA